VPVVSKTGKNSFSLQWSPMVSNYLQCPPMSSGATIFNLSKFFYTFLLEQNQKALTIISCFIKQLLGYRSIGYSQFAKCRNSLAIGVKH